MKTIQITDETYHDLLQIKADAALDGSKHVLSMDDVVQFLLMERGGLYLQMGIKESGENKLK